MDPRTSENEMPETAKNVTPVEAQDGKAKSSQKRQRGFVNLLDFSEIERPSQQEEPATPFDIAERELRRLEIEFGSKYLQIIGVLIISVAFSILGYYPVRYIPVAGQVLFMFLGAGVLLFAGDRLIRTKEMEFYARGLIFAGIKLIYSSFWSLFYNFSMIGEVAFLYTMLLSLGIHYYASIRYRSSALNASFAVLSFVPLIILQDIRDLGWAYSAVFTTIIALDLFQAHMKNESTTIMTVPATAAFYLFLNVRGLTVLDFTFSFDSPAPLLCASIALSTLLMLLFLYLHFRDRTLLTDYLHDYPGTKFSQLTSLFILLFPGSALAFFSAPASLFLIALPATGLVLIHFHARGENYLPLLFLPVTAVLLSIPALLPLPQSERLMALLLIWGAVEAGIVRKRRDFRPIVNAVLPGFPLVLAFLCAIILLAYPEDADYSPGLFLLIAIAFQVFISYTYIQNIHILTGEVVFLVTGFGFAHYTGDSAGYALIWTGLLLFFSAVGWKKKDGPLTAQLLFILSGDFLLTCGYFGDYSAIAGGVLIAALYLLQTGYRGEYFLHRLLVRVNDITVSLRRYRILDLYNTTLLLGLSISFAALYISERGWVLYPLTALLYLHSALRLHRGKLMLPFLLIAFGAGVIYISTLLLAVLMVMFTVIPALLLLEEPDRRTDHYLQIGLFLTIGLSAGVPGLRGAWLHGTLGLASSLRLGTVYGFFVIALVLFIGLSRRYSSLLFTGLAALGELSALMIFTFEYPGSIVAFYGILLLFMAFFGPVLTRFSPLTPERRWARDRAIVLYSASALLFITLIVFNFRDDIPEYSAWMVGIAGAGILMMDDILKSGLHFEDKTEACSRRLTLPEWVALATPTIVALNYSHTYTLQMFLLSYSLILLIIFYRNHMHRFRELILFGLVFFAPFNFLLYSGGIRDRIIHASSDLPPVALVSLYILSYLPENWRGWVRGVRFPDNVEYSWVFSMVVLILGTLTCSGPGVGLIPFMMLAFAIHRRDVITAPSAYVGISAVFYLYYGIVRHHPVAALQGLALLSLFPLYFALLNEAVLKGEPLTFSFSTLSVMLMFGVPWFTDILKTNIIWSVFGGTAFSAGFYLDRRYLRLYGTLFLLAGLIITTYNTYILGIEAVVLSLIIFGLMALVASYFYILSGSRGMNDHHQ